MKHSWKEKLGEQGLKVVEASARLRRIRLPATMDPSEWERWINEQKDVYSSYPDLDAKRKVKLDADFCPALPSREPRNSPARA